jgi:hypothetical protein
VARRPRRCRFASTEAKAPASASEALTGRGLLNCPETNAVATSARPRTGPAHNGWLVMADIPGYLVDGLLSVETHNGVHRLMFYRLSGAKTPEATPCVEIAIPDAAAKAIMDAMSIIL